MTDNKTEVEQVAINDIGTVDDFIKAVDSTIKNFDDGDLVEGTVVKIDHDEVLLDIGYKTEGVIPSKELSIKKDIAPEDVVEVGDRKIRTDALSFPRSVHSMSVHGAM